MKRLLSLAGVDDEGREVYRKLLRSHDIPFHENPASLLGSGDLWVVRDEDHARAKALVDEATARLAAEGRDRFEREYRERFGGAYLHWLAGRIREEPVRLAMIAALVVVLWFGVIWWFVR